MYLSCVNDISFHLSWAEKNVKGETLPEAYLFENKIAQFLDVFISKSSSARKGLR